jgi:hypothetical protein
MGKSTATTATAATTIAVDTATMDGGACHGADADMGESAATTTTVAADTTIMDGGACHDADVEMSESAAAAAAAIIPVDTATRGDNNSNLKLETQKRLGLSKKEVSMKHFKRMGRKASTCFTESERFGPPPFRRNLDFFHSAEH